MYLRHPCKLERLTSLNTCTINSINMLIRYVKIINNITGFANNVIKQPINYKFIEMITIMSYIIITYVL